MQGMICKPEIGKERIAHVVFDTETGCTHTVIYTWLYVNDNVPVYICNKKYYISFLISKYVH